MFVRKLVAYFEGFTSESLSESEAKQSEKEDIEKPSDENFTETQDIQSVVELNKSKCEMIRPSDFITPTLQMLFEIGGFIPYSQGRRLTRSLYRSLVRDQVDKVETCYNISSMRPFPTQATTTGNLDIFKTVLSSVKCNQLSAISKLEKPVYKAQIEDVTPPKSDELLVQSVKKDLRSRYIYPGERFRDIVRSDMRLDDDDDDDSTDNPGKSAISESGMDANETVQLNDVLPRNTAVEVGHGDMPVFGPVTKEQADAALAKTNLFNPSSIVSAENSEKQIDCGTNLTPGKQGSEVSDKKEKRLSFAKYMGCFGLFTRSKELSVVNKSLVESVNEKPSNNTVLEEKHVDTTKEQEGDKKASIRSSEEEKPVVTKTDENIDQKTVEDININSQYSGLNLSYFNQYIMSETVPKSTEEIQWKQSNSVDDGYCQRPQSANSKDANAKLLRPHSLQSVTNTVDHQTLDKFVTSADDNFNKVTFNKKEQAYQEFLSNKDNEKISKYSSLRKCSLADAIVPEVETPSESVSKYSKAKSTLANDHPSSHRSSLSKKAHRRKVDNSTNTLLKDTCDKAIDTCKASLSGPTCTSPSQDSASASKSQSMKDASTTMKVDNNEELKDNFQDTPECTFGSGKPIGKRLLDFFHEQKYLGKSKHRNWHKKETDEFRQYILSRYMRYVDTSEEEYEKLKEEDSQERL